MLHLPHVAQLVGDEIIGHVIRAQEDEPMGGVPVETT